MTREGRLLFLAVLTYFIYAVSMQFNVGAFLFPFPLNGAVLFIVAVQLSFWNRKQYILAINSLLIGLFAVLMNPLYWEFIFSYESLVPFLDSIWTDVFALIYALFIVVFAIITAIKQNGILTAGLALFFLATFGFALYSNDPVYYLGAYGIMSVSVLVKKEAMPFHLLWFLLFFLEFAKVITFAINGQAL